jgi:hypothetical protein
MDSEFPILACRLRAQRVVDDVEVGEQPGDQADLDDFAFIEVRA